MLSTLTCGGVSPTAPATVSDAVPCALLPPLPLLPLPLLLSPLLLLLQGGADAKPCAHTKEGGKLPKGKGAAIVTATTAALTQHERLHEPAGSPPNALASASPQDMLHLPPHLPPQFFSTCAQPSPVRFWPSGSCRSWPTRLRALCTYHCNPRPGSRCRMPWVEPPPSAGQDMSATVGLALVALQLPALLVVVHKDGSVGCRVLRQSMGNMHRAP